jgi:hypothetical protein
MYDFFVHLGIPVITRAGKVSEEGMNSFVLKLVTKV